MTKQETVSDESTVTTNDVATVDGPGGELVRFTKETLVAWLRGDDIAADDATDELDYETALRIMGASDEASVLAQDDVRPVKSLIDESFVVRSITWRRSTKSEDGTGRYAIMRCVDADGTPFLTSCGATKVVLQLHKGEFAGWLPWHVRLNAAETSNNRTVYELVAPEAPF